MPFFPLTFTQFDIIWYLLYIILCTRSNSTGRRRKKKGEGEGWAWRGERGGEEEKKEGGRWGWGGVGGKVVKISALSGLLIMWVCGGSNKHLAKEYKDGGYILCLEG